MLFPIFVAVDSQEVFRSIRMPRVECERIEFVIAHHGLGRSVLAHRAADAENVFDARPAVDEITAEDHLPRWMTEDAGMFFVSESVQKLSQFVSVAVDIADDVVHGETGEVLIFDF